MQSQSRTPKSMRISDKWLGPAASAEVRRLLALPESKRMHECRAPKSPSDRKVARRCNHSVVIAARGPLRARGDHPIGRTRLTQSGKPWHTPERVRSFAD